MHWSYEWRMIEVQLGGNFCRNGFLFSREVNTVHLIVQALLLVTFATLSDADSLNSFKEFQVTLTWLSSLVWFQTSRFIDNTSLLIDGAAFVKSAKYDKCVLDLFMGGITLLSSENIELNVKVCSELENLVTSPFADQKNRSVLLSRFA